jgi:hypothetical protein
VKEILPGVFHWTTYHEGIGQDVHSYYVSAADPACLIDPRVPAEGIGWFKRHESPANIYLTNRLHYRHSKRFAIYYGAEVWCHKEGLHAFGRDKKVTGFGHGDGLPGGVLALKVGVLCPEETAFYIPLGKGILSIGDAIIRDDGDLEFVPDYLMGDDPEGVKRGLKKVFTSHLTRNFDAMLFAHGEPIISGAKKELRRFLKGLDL